MAREINKLTALQVGKIAEPGYYSDGYGLYLQVSKSGSKSWIFRFTLDGKTRDMGLGRYPTTSLAEARDAAHEARKLKQHGIDPIEQRKEERASSRAASVRLMTFKECARTFIKAKSPGWSNIKHARQWESTLDTYANQVFGGLAASDIRTDHIMRALEPIWNEKNETASRVRQRIESVLDWAKTHGYRNGENPARWKGHLENLLPSPSKVRETKHHKALPYKEINPFIVELRKHNTISARALEYLILTATRTSEVTDAKWDEIDLANKVWTIPAERTKTKKEHRVPLSEPAIRILKKMASIRHSDFVFPGQNEGAPLSNMAMLQLIKKRMNRDITAHGFRSTFRDWAAEQTNHQSEVAEMALGHAVGSKVEAAYRRGDMFDKRRNIMDDWAAYCERSAHEDGQNIVNFQEVKNV